MRLFTFDTAYLPDSANIAAAVSCTVNVERISMILPLEGNLSGAKTLITVDGRDIHVLPSPEEVVALLNNAMNEQKTVAKKRAPIFVKENPSALN